MEKDKIIFPSSLYSCKCASLLKSCLKDATSATHTQNNLFLIPTHCSFSLLREFCDHKLYSLSHNLHNVW